MDDDSPEEHDNLYPEHSGRRGHFCVDSGDMWICADCDEIEDCDCFEIDSPGLDGEDDDG